MNKRSKLAALLGAGLLTFAVAGTTLAVTYATVDGHDTATSENNNPDFWGDDCTKLNAGEGDLGTGVDSYTLTADYDKVIVKAGQGEFSLTIFEDVTAGETVWADTNGNNTFDPGGQDGDKNISHIIFCGEGPGGGGGGDTDQPPTDALPGTTGSSGPTDGAWLLVVALGVLLASIVVLTPARAKSRR